MAFIDVFSKETQHRSIYGTPSPDDKSSKMFILEFLAMKVPDNTLEKSKLIYLYGKYNIGDNVTSQSTTSIVGPPVPDPSPLTYLKTDGSNTLQSGYVPSAPLSIASKEYVDDLGVGLLLGETSTTAYRGDHGLIAYVHSQSAHAPSDAEANRPISDSLTLASSFTSASSLAVKLLNDNKANSGHNHDLIYEPINANIQTHINNSAIHVNQLLNLLDVPPYTGNQGKLLKVNATEDGTIWGDPSGVTASWGDITGTLGVQTDLQDALDGKVDNSQVLTDVPVGALFTDTIYDDSSLTAHLSAVGTNPHGVSATDVNLDNVDNTADIDKPVSTATAVAIGLKEDDLSAPTQDGLFLSSLTDKTRSWTDPLVFNITPPDLKYSGITVIMTAGEIASFGALMYVKSDGKLWRANSSGVNTFPVVGVLTEASTADSAVKVLIYGVISNSSWTLTTGESVYLDENDGAFTQIAPDTLGDTVQTVGVALSATEMFFNPNMVDVISYVEDTTPPDTLTVTLIEEL